MSVEPTEVDWTRAEELADRAEGRGPAVTHRMTAHALAEARAAGRQEILEELGEELRSHAQALADSLEGDLGLARLVVERLADYGVAR